MNRVKGFKTGGCSLLRMRVLNPKESSYSAKDLGMLNKNEKERERTKISTNKIKKMKVKQ